MPPKQNCSLMLLAEAADVVYDVLEAADMLLLGDLKRQCGHYLAAHVLEPANAVDLVAVARLYDIPKLEQCAVECMAGAIEVR